VTAALDDAHSRLRGDEVLWLTTVDDSGQPQSSPVWFHWDGEDALILSRPDAPKVANVEHHPQVSLHLNGGEAGTLVVSLEATAQVEPLVSAARRSAYAEKYRQGFVRLGTDASSYFAEFSTALVARPRRVRCFETE
jgi:PPOX class probable F420-dependent enzyme